MVLAPEPRDCSHCSLARVGLSGGTRTHDPLITRQMRSTPCVANSCMLLQTKQAPSSARGSQSLLAHCLPTCGAFLRVSRRVMFRGVASDCALSHPPHPEFQTCRREPRIASPRFICAGTLQNEDQNKFLGRVDSGGWRSAAASKIV
jgi:hypothetical protein